MSLLDTAINVVSGGATTGILGMLSGLVGSVVTSVTNYKMKKLDLEVKKSDNEYKLKLRNLDIEAIKVEADAEIQISQEKTRGKISEIDAESYKASQSNVDKPLFYQDYMNYLTTVATAGKWYSCIAGIVIFIISLGFAAVDMMKHTTRPALTWYVMGLATWVTAMAYKISERAHLTLTGKEAFGLLLMSYHVVLYLAVTAFSWWFCDRQIAKFVAKRLGWDDQK